MELFDYLMAKKGHNVSARGDLFSYLLGKKASGGSGTYTTFSGTSLNISNTIKAAIKKFMLNSTELTQDGTPTPDNPVDVNVITGSNNIKITDGTEEQNYPITLSSDNLLNLPTKLVEVTKNGLTFTPVYIGDALLYINVNGTATADTEYYIIDTTDRLTLPAGSYLFSSGVDGSNSTYFVNFSARNLSIISNYSGNTSLTINSSDNFWFLIKVRNGITVDNVKFKPFMRVSTSTSEYAPYIANPLEYCKIGDYADQFIRTNGKNLAKPLRYGVYNANTGEYIYSTDYTCSSEPITITSNEYIFSIDGIASGGYAYEFSSSNSYLRRVYIDNTGIYTPTSDASYFQYAFKDATVSNVPLNSNVQIEEGNTVTDFEPYGINEWYLKKNIGKKFFKDVAWAYYSASICFYASISDIYIESSSNVMFKGFCNIYNKTTSDSLVAWSSKSDLQIGMRVTANNIIVKDSNYTDATTFKNARGNDYFYYVLATPTYIHISENDYPILRSQLENLYNNAKSYNGQTNITQTNDDLPFNISVNVKVLDTNLNMSNSLNSSLLSNNLQNEEETSLDNTNEIDEIEEPIEEYEEL